MHKSVIEQNWKEQNKKDFLIEHYTQVNEHLRESDRNRNILLAVYSALVAGIFSFMYSVGKLDLVPKLVMLGFLIAFGICIALYTTFARAWHCEYTRVAKAIHKSFLNADLRLYKAAKEIKKDDENRHRHYFNTRGTEFIIMVSVLLFVSAELVLIIFELKSEGLPCPICLSIISLLLVLGVGIGYYSRYLDKREDEFPDDSWCIVKMKEDKMTESELEEIKAHLTNIESKLDKSQKFGWSGSFYLVGITALAVGIGLLTHNPFAWGGWLIVLVGLIISIIGVVLLFRYGWFSKR